MSRLNKCIHIDATSYFLPIEVIVATMGITIHLIRDGIFTQPYRVRSIVREPPPPLPLPQIGFQYLQILGGNTTGRENL